MWGMGSNPWVQEPAPPEPVGDGEEALRVDYRRWAAGAEVTASRRLGHVSAGGTGLWVVGAHGGSGASTRAGLLDAGDAGQSWPVPAASGDGVRAVVTARTCAAGLEAARAAAVEWVEGACPGVELVGLLLGGRSRQTPQGPSQARPRRVGAFPLVLSVPWQPAWRLTQPGEAPRSLRVLRITKTINNSGRKNS